jgi:hypothetical protein
VGCSDEFAGAVAGGQSFQRVLDASGKGSSAHGQRMTHKAPIHSPFIR